MKKHLKWMIPALVLVLLAMVFLLYTADCYRADASALSALESDGDVAVDRTDYGWFFDGPAENEALIFYPGGKVEETAYAPLLHQIAAGGMDVCLVKMPFHLAVFGINKAEKVMKEYHYDRWVIGGHSLGGAMAASFAASRDDLTGLVLLAAYPTKAFADEDLTVLSLCGSEDGVLNMDKLHDAEPLLPEHSLIHLIAGGNHAQFGNYGEQKGDRKARISAEAQQQETADFVLQSLK